MVRGKMETGDLDARLSYVSSTHMKNQDEYLEGKTPNDVTLEEGALRAGGAPDMWSKENIGVVFQYCVVGLFDMLLQGSTEQYGGDFDFHVSFTTLCLIYGIIAMPVIPMTWFYIHEERAGFIDRKKYMGELWDFCCTRVVYQNLVYEFVSGIFISFSIIEGYAIQTFWAGVKNFNYQIFGVVGQIVFVLALKVTSKWGLHWDWRIMIAVTQIVVVGLDSTCTLLTTWNIVRNQWFYLGEPILLQVPYGINFIVSSFITVELINEGSEGAAYGLLTTVNNLTGPVSTVLTQMVDRKFDVSNARIMEDDHAVRMDVTWTLLIMYSMNLLSIVWLFLLPRQKAETREMKVNGGSNKLLGGSILAFMALALAYSVFYNIMQIFPETACMKIVGGEGCGGGDS